jgi:hypothetical protein
MVLPNLVYRRVKGPKVHRGICHNPTVMNNPYAGSLFGLCDPVHTAPAICRPGWGEDSENHAAVSALLEGVGVESQVGVGGVLPMICSHLSGIFLLSA